MMTEDFKRLGAKFNTAQKNLPPNDDVAWQTLQLRHKLGVNDVIVRWEFRKLDPDPQIQTYIDHLWEVHRKKDRELQLWARANPEAAGRVVPPGVLYGAKVQAELGYQTQQQLQKLAAGLLRMQREKLKYQEQKEREAEEEAASSLASLQQAEPFRETRAQTASREKAAKLLASLTSTTDRGTNQRAAPGQGRRCAATTRAGKRCSRQCDGRSKFCVQHGRNKGTP